MEQTRRVEDHHVRLGGFHGVSSLLSSYGKIWGSAGLRDLLSNSDVYAEGTVDMILQGKDFNRGVRAFILAYEALAQLRFEGFIKWLEENQQKISQSVWY